MYTLHIPAKPEHIVPACAIAQHHFNDDRPSDAEDLIIHTKNPFQLATITDQHGDVVAYTDIYVLQKTYHDQLISGQLTEDQLVSDNFPAWPEAQNTDCIYCAGAAVINRKHPDRAIWATALLHGGLGLLKYYIQNDKAVECALIAYSLGGIKIAETIGFECRGVHGYGPLYVGQMTANTVAQIKAFLPSLDARIVIAS